MFWHDDYWQFIKSFCDFGNLLVVSLSVIPTCRARCGERSRVFRFITLMGNEIGELKLVPDGQQEKRSSH